MNSRHSRTALGLPGRLTMRACFRMPAAARESMARGVIWRDCHRMASAMPGAGRSTTDRVASGVRSVGENPEAADVSGINVNRIRFSTVLVAGAFGGLAGSFYTVGYLGMFTTGIIGGRGWIAFAICFLGNWNPKGAVFGTLVFGLAEAISIYLQSTGGIAILPNEFVIALPYILTIALTIAKRSFNVPAKLGVPYLKES